MFKLSEHGGCTSSLLKLLGIRPTLSLASLAALSSRVLSWNLNPGSSTEIDAALLALELDLNSEV